MVATRSATKLRRFALHAGIIPIRCPERIHSLVENLLLERWTRPMTRVDILNCTGVAHLCLQTESYQIVHRPEGRRRQHGSGQDRRDRVGMG